MKSVEQVTISLDVMRVDGKIYYIGKDGLMSPVPHTAFSVISQLEVLMNEKLKET